MLYHSSKTWWHSLGPSLRCHSHCFCLQFYIDASREFQLSSLNQDMTLQVTYWWCFPWSFFSVVCLVLLIASNWTGPSTARPFLVREDNQVPLCLHSTRTVLIIFMSWHGLLCIFIIVHKSLLELARSKCLYELVGLDLEASAGFEAAAAVVSPTPPMMSRVNTGGKIVNSFLVSLSVVSPVSTLSLSRSFFLLPTTHHAEKSGGLCHRIWTLHRS